MYVRFGGELVTKISSCFLILLANIANQSGTIGWSGQEAQFMKLKVLESYSVDANNATDRIYLTCKAPDGQLGATRF